MGTSLQSDRPTPVSAAPKADRLWGLDQARAVAIFAMILAHFAPGVFLRMPQLGRLEMPVLWFGRLATPAFMVIFGVTAGFVFLPRYVAGNPRDTARRLVRRAAVVFLCAIVITVPRWIAFHRKGITDPWEWTFEAYSVLLFYTFGVGLLPLWLRWLAKDTLRRGIAAGVGLWAVGTLLYHVWPGRPEDQKDTAGFLRMVLFAGPYAYCQMMGTTLVAVPAGLWLRQRLDAGDAPRALVQLYVLGMTCALAGGCWGIALGEFDPAKIISGQLRIPPRAWYFLHFGGLSLSLIPALEYATKKATILRRPGYVLALFGQTSLLLFTGSELVLPGLALLDHVGTLQGTVRVVIPFLAFAVFCGLVARVRHRQVTAKAAAPRL